VWGRINPEWDFLKNSQLSEQRRSRIVFGEPAFIQKPPNFSWLTVGHFVSRWKSMTNPFVPEAEIQRIIFTSRQLPIEAR